MQVKSKFSIFIIFIGLFTILSCGVFGQFENLLIVSETAEVFETKEYESNKQKKSLKLLIEDTTFSAMTYSGANHLFEYLSLVNSDNSLLSKNKSQRVHRQNFLRGPPINLV